MNTVVTPPTAIFDELARACPVAVLNTTCIITVVLDLQNLLGKNFTQLPDGKIKKTSAVAISRGIACQFYVPDIETMQKVLLIVSENPHAAIINSCWKHAAIGERFVFLSKKTLQDRGLEPEAVTTADGMKAFARLKIHAKSSSWQLLDRDVDSHTPERASKQSFADWKQDLDKILPGIAKVRMLRAYSSSSRVLQADNTLVGGGNSHVWIMVKDAADAERTRTAITARSLEFGPAWTKPRISKSTGQECGRGLATIVDASVWTVGRLVFVGSPTCSSGLTITAQRLEIIEGEDDTLDTSKSVISCLNTFRASTKQGVPMRLSRDSKGYSSEIYNLKWNTELEMEDGGIKTVEGLAQSYTAKIRCQTPFRASMSMAAFLVFNDKGEPMVYDSGTNTKHFLAKSLIESTDDKDIDSLIREVASRIGNLVGDDNVNAVFNDEVLRTAWNSTYCIQTNNKIAVLNKNDELVELSMSDNKQFGFRRSFGSVFYSDMLDEVIAEMSLAPKDENELRKNLIWIEHGPFMECIKLLKQAKSLDIKVNMFSKRAALTVSDNVATITLPHNVLSAKLLLEPHVIKQVEEDYIQHFPEFPALLSLILHARFASDRRHAFVWLHSASAWGKGFMVAIFTQLGLVVELSSAEIEKAVAGGPVGVSATDTLRAWILFVDEFKSASSELKQLNSQMIISPKNQLRCKVQLYAKIFVSVENVRSLVGNGVESQFNNRFAYVSPCTRDQKLEDRSLYISLGKTVYLGAMVSHVANYLNGEVARMRGMGEIESSKLADNFIAKYQSERRLNATFGNLDDAVNDMADEIRTCLIEYANWYKQGHDDQSAPDIVKGIGLTLLNTLKRNSQVGYICEGDNSKRRLKGIVLGNSVSFIKDYIALLGDHSIVSKMQYKADEIAGKLHMRKEHYRGKVRVYDSEDEGAKHTANKHGIVVFFPDSPTHTQRPEQTNIAGSQIQKPEFGFKANPGELH